MELIQTAEKLTAQIRELRNRTYTQPEIADRLAAFDADIVAIRILEEEKEACYRQLRASQPLPYPSYKGD